MAGRNETLIADEGMRILMNEVPTKAPYFIASNDELWNAWREIQRNGTGARIADYWRITSKFLPNGGSVMSLHIQFDPIKNNEN